MLGSALLAGGLSCGRTSSDAPVRVDVGGSSQGGSAVTAPPHVAGAGDAPEAGTSASTGGADDGSVDSPDGVVWRASPEPFCASNGAGFYGAVDLWSDAEGVFLLLESTLYANFGDGWRELAGATRTNTPLGISGFAGGPLVRYGSFGCGIELIERGGQVSCSAGTDASALQVVSSDLAYAAYDNRLLVYAGDYWQQRGTPFEPETGLSLGLWADAESVAVIATSGVYLAVGEGPLERVLQVPVEQEETGIPFFRSVWGLGADDLWVGDGSGQLRHYDGRSWSTPWVSDADVECSRVGNIWASDGELFFSTTNAVFVSRNGEVETLVTLPCTEGERVWSIWGNSADEVFVALQTAEATSCGGIRLLWFDGVKLRPF